MQGSYLCPSNTVTIIYLYHPTPQDLPWYTLNYPLATLHMHNVVSSILATSHPPSSHITLISNITHPLSSLVRSVVLALQLPVDHRYFPTPSNTHTSSTTPVMSNTFTQHHTPPDITPQTSPVTFTKISTLNSHHQVSYGDFQDTVLYNTPHRKGLHQTQQPTNILTPCLSYPLYVASVIPVQHSIKAYHA